MKCEGSFCPLRWPNKRQQLPGSAQKLMSSRASWPAALIVFVLCGPGRFTRKNRFDIVHAAVRCHIAQQIIFADLVAERDLVEDDLALM
jgi:hypothetical protein